MANAKGNELVLMSSPDRVKERQKKEREARRAEERDEQRQDAIREQKLKRPGSSSKSR